MNEKDDVSFEDEVHPEDVDLVEEEAQAGDAIKKVRNDLASCRKEKAEYLDGWQRAKADYVNALKRFEEERKIIANAGVTRSVIALLPAMDSLERAKEHGEIPEDFAGIVKQLETGFASLDLKELGSEGEIFDPSLHDAVGQDIVESKDEDNKITAVLEKGWRIGESVIRPAKVRVGIVALEQ